MQIKENDYNLNVTLYVFPKEITDEIDVNKEWSDIKSIESDLKNLERQIDNYLKEIL
jgi:type I restriction enzyme M protein